MLFFLISVFVASVISEPHLSRHLRHGNMNLWQPRYPNKSRNENHNCVCFNKVQNRDTKLFGETSFNQLKRLVVYFYKDSKSNTVRLYAPNKENQIKFPDLASNDVIDLSRVELDKVGQLFEAYQTAVKFNKTQRFTDSDIINLVIDNSAIIYKPSGHQNSSESQRVEDSNTNKKSYIETHPSSSNNETASSTNLHGFVISSGANEYTKENEGKYIASQSSDEGLIADLDSEIQNNPEKKKVSVNVQPSSNAGNSGTLDESNLSSEWSQDVNQPALEDAESSKSSESVFSGLDLPYELHRKPITNEVSKNYSKYTSGLKLSPETVSGSKSQLHRIDIDDYIVANDKNNRPPKRTHRLPTQSDDTGKGYVTFDKWFGQQVHTIKKTGKSPTKNMNLLSLKHLIEKTLYENGFFVTKDGILTDSKANALDVANLKLRPILIGDSVAYDNVFPVKGDNYQLPSNLPYLESVLVTLVDPPKILGVIPLGKTFVPRVSYRGGLDYLAWRARSLRKCESLECRLEKVRIYNLYKKQSSTNQQSNNYVVYSNEKRQNSNEKKREKAKQFGKYLKQIYGNINSNVPFQQSMVNDRRNKQSFRLDLKKMFEAFKSNLFPPFNAPNPLTELNRKAYFPKKASDLVKAEYEDESEDWKEDEEEEELPGFRIIGGFPATSSGTPVSNKGRIGHMFA